MYEIRDITDATEEEYEEILDEEMIQNLDREYYRAIAAFDKEDVVKGVIVWVNRNVNSEEDVFVSIEMIKADGEDCAEDLIRGYIEWADEVGIDKTVFELSILDKEYIKVFEDNGFVVKEKEGESIVVTIEELSKIKSLTKVDGKYSIVPLSDIYTLQFKRAVSNCVIAGKLGLEDDIFMLPKNWFDEELSCCILEEDVVTGLFLIHCRKEGPLVPELMVSSGSDSDKHILGMLRFSAEAMIQKYDSDKEIIINRHNDKVRQLCGYLFPGKKGTAVLAGERKR